MNTWNPVQSILQKWRSRKTRSRTANPEQQLLEANRNLKDLLDDSSVPAAVRAELSEEFDEIEQISDKLREGEIHIAAFGRVGVGKSSLLNALMQREVFSTSPLHGETREETRASWGQVSDSHIVLIDTPGIDELDGEERAELAERVSRRADIILMLCEGDLTRTEFEALQALCQAGRIVLLVLNKTDRYTDEETKLLLDSLRSRCSEFLPPEQVVPACADPRPERVVYVDSEGHESEQQRERAADTANLKTVLWDLLEKDGKSLAALNAALFASELDGEVARRIVAARKTVADRIIRNYCLSKGVLVAANPVPVADLLAAAGVDVAMVIHLGEVYGFRLSRREASKLLLTISAQLIALMSAYWGVNLVSSALKTASAGLSTALTAGAQGALAWYATYLTGKLAQTWFAKGKSWGNAGPRETAREILASLDRDSLIRSARGELARRFPE